MSGSPASRVALIDGLKAVASQLIVLHHLAFYGPMSDVAWPLAPGFWGWLANDARMAVQIFLVLAGFLAARSLAPHGRLQVKGVLPALWNRYVRLALPYVAMLVLAIVASAVARRWMVNDAISAAPSAPQLLAHVLLLHDVLGFEALSAGVWYVAIDLQLFALLLAVLWVARRLARWLGQGARATAALSAAGVGGLGTAALFYFNLDAGWDAWALYFFGSYALGVFAWWASNRDASPWWAIGITALGMGALSWAWRDRIAVALAVALLLTLARRVRWAANVKPDLPGVAGDVLGRLAQVSYSLFLVHFPVCLVVNALFAQFAPASSWVHLGGTLLAWALSLASAVVFHEQIEKRAGLLVWRPRSAGMGRQGA